MDNSDHRWALSERESLSTQSFQKLLIGKPNNGVWWILLYIRVFSFCFFVVSESWNIFYLWANYEYARVQFPRTAVNPKIAICESVKRLSLPMVPNARKNQQQRSELNKKFTVTRIKSNEMSVLILHSPLFLAISCQYIDEIELLAISIQKSIQCKHIAWNMHRFFWTL